MKRALFLPLAAALAAVPAHAQVISGPAVAVDGDTLEMTGFAIRLFGIDAPEAGQVCHRDGEAWPCGAEAAALLAELVAGEAPACEQRGTDADGRLVAVCTAGPLDLAATLVGAGYALALAETSDDYAARAEQARRHRLGLWASEFEDPAAYRAAHPVPPPRRLAPDDTPRARAASLYFRNCAEARAAGAAPLYAGQPGYRPQMDGDGDGVACEPYRGRR